MSNPDHYMTGGIFGICIVIGVSVLLSQICPPPIGGSWKEFQTGALFTIAASIVILLIIVAPAVLMHIYNIE